MKTMTFSEAYDNVAAYPERWLRIAESRGWRRDAHITALMNGDEDAVTLTHPTNDLSEFEMEGFTPRNLAHHVSNDPRPDFAEKNVTVEGWVNTVDNTMLTMVVTSPGATVYFVLNDDDRKAIAQFLRG